MKRHAKPRRWPVIVLISVFVIGLGGITVYPDIMLLNSMMNENTKLIEQVAWFTEKWNDRPPLDYGAGQW